MRLDKIAKFMLLLALAASVPGLARTSSGLPECSPGLSAQAPRNPAEFAQFQSARAKCKKSWAVLVYMAGNNDLAPYAYWDLHEMEGVGSSRRLDVVAQLEDNVPAHGTRRYAVFKQDQSQDPAVDKLNVDYFSQKMDAAARSPYLQLPPIPSDRQGKRDHGMALHDFLLWGMKQFPADHYMLVLWGHGQGWARLQKTSGPKVNRERGGLAFNTANGTYLDIPTIHGVMRSAEKQLLDGEPIDVYASDACFMQMAEVAFELSDSARFISGSAQVQTFLGLPYGDLLREMSGEGSMPPFAHIKRVQQFRGVTDEGQLVAGAIPFLVQNSLVSPQGSQRVDKDSGQTFTSSSFSTSPLRERLIPSLTRFSHAMWSYLGGAKGRARADAVINEINQSMAFDGNALDMEAFFGHLETIAHELAEKEGNRGPDASERELLASIAEIESALNEAVVSYAYGALYTQPQYGFPMFHSKVMSFWLPPDEISYKTRIRDFMPSAFYKATRWNLWLNRLYKQPEPTPQQPGGSQQPTQPGNDWPQWSS